jgi:hypothetical protein
MRDNDAALLRLLTADNTAEDGHERFLPSDGGTGAVANAVTTAAGGSIRKEHFSGTYEARTRVP